MKEVAAKALMAINDEKMKKCEENICSTSEKEYIDKQMEAVEEIMKKQSGTECRKNVWETVNKLMEKYPCCVDYIDNLYNGFVKKNKIDFFEDIK